jgi:hypothetical protein
VLIWLWLTSLALLFGAELDAEVEAARSTTTFTIGPPLGSNRGSCSADTESPP